MDKINRALTASEDNAASIAELRAKIKNAVGTTFEIRAGENGSLGVVDAPKGGVAVIFFDGGAVSVGFCGFAAGSGSSPVLAKLKSASGELKLADVRQNLRALILYNT